jgi:hypothetical protein
VLATAAVLAAVAMLARLTVPSAPVGTRPPPGDLTAFELRGAIHIHSRASDGTGTREEIAAAAARAGLQFVAITDHGDGTRPPHPPEYLDGVLCLDGVEISTTGGHYLALGLPAAPYRLAGEPRDVVEDVRRLGGVGVVAHPDSAKPELRWDAWDAPVDGLEWLNADSEWRDEASRVSLVLQALAYPWRPAGALVRMFDRPKTLARWDALTRTRAVIAVAGVDAHARIGVGGRDPYENRVLARLPSYEAIFRTLSVHVRLSAPATHDARRDAAALVDALRRGRVYTAIDALAAPAFLDFTASSPDGPAQAGDVLPAAAGTTLLVRATLPAGGRIVLLRDGTPVATTAEPRLTFTAAREAAVFRVEVAVPRAPGTPPVPWIVSNPIYLRAEPIAEPPAAPETPPAETHALFSDGDASGWTIESDTRSTASIDSVASDGGRALALRYTLGSGSRAGQYVAVTPGSAPVARFHAVRFRARSDRPQRLSVQLRAPAAGRDWRWQRSVYVPTEGTRVTVRFADMTPVAGAPPLDRAGADALLFVVDTTNTLPGASGTIWLDEVELIR